MCTWQLSEWSKEDVCEWLGEQGLAEYCHNFRAQAIDGRELVTLSEDTLEHQLGVGMYPIILLNSIISL